MSKESNFLIYCMERYRHFKGLSGADVAKTFEEYGSFMEWVALTVIVAQNPKDWAHDIFPIDLPTIERQIATVGEGIGINAMKTGMLGSAALVELVAKSID